MAFDTVVSHVHKMNYSNFLDPKTGGVSLIFFACNTPPPQLKSVWYYQKSTITRNETDAGEAKRV